MFDDTHDEHVDAERRAAVENALSVLGSSLDYQWTLAALTRLMVPALADYCSVDLVEPDGSIRRVSTTHVDPDKEMRLREMWTRHPIQPTDPVGVPEVIRTGLPQVIGGHRSGGERRVRAPHGPVGELALLAPRSLRASP